MHRDRRARRCAGVRPRPRERRVRLRGRRGARRLPEAVPPELRRVRRAPVLRARDASSCSSSWATCSSGRRSARTSGSRGRPRPTSRSPARRCSSTSPPRRSTWARRRIARRCSSRGRATTPSYFAFCNLVGGQDELVFDGHSVVLDDEGEVVARAPGFEEALLVVDLDPHGGDRPPAARRPPARARAVARRARAATTIAVGAARTPWSPVAASSTPFAPELEQMRLGARARPARLRPQERLRRRRGRDLGWDRLRAHGRDRRRRARRRARPHRLDAVALLVGGDARATRAR